MFVEPFVYAPGRSLLLAMSLVIKQTLTNPEESGIRKVAQ